MSIGKKIKELRKNNKWTQTELAEKIETDTRRISCYENDLNFPAVETLIKISEIFGVTLDYLVSDNVRSIATSKIDDVELLKKFEEISKLNKKDKETVNTFLDAFIKKRKFEEIIN